MIEPRPWHRLFGLSWMDFFQGTDVDVETELDLSIKQQFLDLVLIRKGPRPIPRRLPDGFDQLAAHNLVTFKSYQETLNEWAIWELIGHYVNYRKQSSPSLQELLPETDYRLFAVCARFPQQLAQQFELAPVTPGVYEIRLGTLTIPVIVVNQLPLADHNVMLHLFSAQVELLRFATEHYRPHSPDTSSLLFDLFVSYSEDPDMATKFQELLRQTTEEIMQRLPAEERLKGLPAKERLKGLSAEEVAKALDPEVLEALVNKHKANGASSNLQ